MNNLHVIALIDCDSFFVACEQLKNPSLLNKPVCVLSNNDGCVIARSKEAKEMGVKMGMPYFMAKKDFPAAIYLSSNHTDYASVSKHVMEVLTEFSPAIEQYSIDEAFVDLTGLRKLYRRSYLEIAKMIRAEIKAKVGIPVSIGVGTTKTIAKLSSEKAKPAKGGEGAYIIGNRSLKKELQDTELGEVWGVGKNTCALLGKYGIKNAYEFSQQSDEWLQAKLGIRGLQLKHELLGTAVYKLETTDILPKSIQKTSSFAKFTNEKEYIKNSIIYHINRACCKLRAIGMKTGCVRLILRTKDFKFYTEKKLLVSPTSWDTDILKNIIPLFEKLYLKDVLYRSSGVVLENLIKESDTQMSLFNNYENEEKKESLSRTIDKLSRIYKKNIVKIGYGQPPQNG